MNTIGNPEYLTVESKNMNMICLSISLAKFAQFMTDVTEIDYLNLNLINISGQVTNF